MLRFIRDQPVHLFDAYTGNVRAFYRPYNAMDELESPNVVCFSPGGEAILAGGFRTDRTLHLFDISRPGRDSTILRLGKTRKSSDGQKGLVSALAYAQDPSSNQVAVGTYSPGSIYLYDQRTEQPSGTILSGLCVVGHGRSYARKKRRFVEGPGGEEAGEDNDSTSQWLSNAKLKWFIKRAQGGITQLKFAPNQPHILYSSSRRSDVILSWDLRMLTGQSNSDTICGLGSFATCADTNQRLQFDLDSSGEGLFAAGKDNCLRVYDVASGKQTSILEDLNDCCNGVSCFAQSDKGNSLLVAVTTGAYHFPTEEDLENNDRVFASQDRLTGAGSLCLYNLRYGSKTC